ncbi:MAG: TIGR04086 family membrane protein [Clostridia bacterium]|nr:TIGR04086 family membrane protein [Clostridia bacterium]
MYNNEYKSVKDTGAVKVSAAAFSKAMLWALGLTSAVLLLAALLLTYTPISETLIPTIAILTAVLSAMSAGVAASRSVKNRGWLTGIFAGILYSIILYIFSSLASDGFHFSGYVIVMSVISMLAGAIGGILGVNMPNKRKR